MATAALNETRGAGLHTFTPQSPTDFLFVNAKCLVIPPKIGLRFSPIDDIDGGFDEFIYPFKDAPRFGYTFSELTSINNRTIPPLINVPANFLESVELSPLRYTEQNWVIENPNVFGSIVFILWVPSQFSVRLFAANDS